MPIAQVGCPAMQTVLGMLHSTVCSILALLVPIGQWPLSRQHYQVLASMAIPRLGKTNQA